MNLHFIYLFIFGVVDLDSIPGRVIPKTWKMVLDTFLLNTQQYKVRIKGKVEQSREMSSVTLCRWSTKQMIPLSILARNQTKAWARDLDVTGSG